MSPIKFLSTSLMSFYHAQYLEFSTLSIKSVVISLWVLTLVHIPNMFPFWSNAPFATFSENLQLLRQRYYYATWKADGTRYMMLIMRDGCFLIDRNFCFRRVQMRFPHKSLEVRRPLCWENNNWTRLFLQTSNLISLL